MKVPIEIAVAYSLMRKQAEENAKFDLIAWIRNKIKTKGTMIEFKIQYNHKGKQHSIVGITNGAMTEPAHRENNQLTEVNVFKDNQRPNDRWNIGPSYIHSLYFDNQGATLYFKISTGADGKIKRRDFIGMTVFENNEELGTTDVVNVEYSVQTRYIE